MTRIPLVFACAISAMLSSPLSAQIPEETAVKSGHMGFAAEAENQTLSNGSCRDHGGVPIAGNHAEVVLSIGRRDSRRRNVIYYGGHYYVAYRVRVSSFFSDEIVLRLCHFSHLEQEPRALTA